MGKKYRKYKNSIEKFMSSPRGRRFFHYSYSIGAAVVILGALFKINHYPYGTEILMIGMIVEAAVFLLSAFDTPAKDYKWEEVYPVLADQDDTQIDADSIAEPHIQGAGGGIGGTVIIGGGGGSAAVAGSGGTVGGGVAGATIIGGVGGGMMPADTADIVDASEKYAEQLSKASENMEKFAQVTGSLSLITDALLESFKSVSEQSTGLGDNTKGYLSQMETLNRNIAGLNTIYEIQLKGASGQIHTIEQINAGLDRIKRLYDGSLVDSSIFKNETEKMAQHLTELNRVYSRLLQAMTVNMNMSMGGFTNPNPVNINPNIHYGGHDNTPNQQEETK